jgi:hypothetical protein
MDLVPCPAFPDCGSWNVSRRSETLTDEGSHTRGDLGPQPAGFQTCLRTPARKRKALWYNDDQIPWQFKFS